MVRILSFPLLFRFSFRMKCYFKDSSVFIVQTWIFLRRDVQYSTWRISFEPHTQTYERKKKRESNDWWGWRVEQLGAISSPCLFYWFHCILLIFSPLTRHFVFSSSVIFVLLHWWRVDGEKIFVWLRGSGRYFFTFFIEERRRNKKQKQSKWTNEQKRKYRELKWKGDNHLSSSDWKAKDFSCTAILMD